jgi:hypothetical protein
LEKGRYEVTAEELCIFSMEAQSTLEIEVEINRI